MNYRRAFPVASPRLALPLVISLASIASIACAQPSGIEEVIVTADFRKNSLDRIAASISVLDKNLIQRKNAQHLEDVLLNAANANMAAGSSRARYVQLRGIGETGQFAEPLNSSVGMLIDGVDFSGIGAAAMLYDIEQVEILQGPQGTRYGSNALAGLINLQSKAPTSEPAHGLQLQGENYAGRGIAGFIAGPLGNDTGFRLAAQSLQSDGFGTNTHLKQTTNSRNEQTVRGTLQWQSTPTLQLTLRGGVIDIDNSYDAFSLDNGRDTQSDEPGHDQQRSGYASVEVLSTGFAAFNLQAILTSANSDVSYGYDEDWVYPGFHPDGYSSTDLYQREHTTVSGELRLLSSPAGALLGGRTAWTAGIYVLQQKIDLQRVYTYAASDFRSAMATDRYALYADTTTQFADRWSLDIGLRAERYNANYRDSAHVYFTPKDYLFGGKLALNYTTSSGNLLYASASRGYKSGGFNTDGSLDVDLREYGSETLWNYEAGFKGTALNNRAHWRAALFWMDRNDVQIQSSTLRVRANGSTEFIEYTGNAAAGFNRGLELNVDYTTNDQLTLYGTLGVLESEYQNFINSSGDNLDGRQQAHAPSYQYTVGSRWRLLPSVTFDVNVQGRDAFYFSDSHSLQSDAYDLVNTSLSWQQNRWLITLWGRNLTDQDYQVRGYYFGNDPRDGYAEHLYTQLGEPLRYGLTVNTEF